MPVETANGADPLIPPSSIFVFWPGDQPPMAEEIRLRLGEFGAAAPHADAETAENSAENTAWSFWLELADRPVSQLVWCERVGGPHLALLDRVRFRDPQQEVEARACRWVVGVEGPLSLRNPVQDYQLQLRICEAVARDWAPVTFDASGFVFRTAEETQRLAAARVPPRTSQLYGVHQVRCNGDRAVAGGEPRRYWLHTHGLERAGVPDLEIFEVPEQLVDAACEAIETVASLWIQYQTPAPETPFAIGADLEIAWRPWQAQVEEMPHAAVGGWRYRRDEFAHAGYRAVLVAAKPVGGVVGRFGRVWRPPVETLERIASPATALYRSQYETRRMAQVARERWPSFGMLFAGRRPRDWRFAVKLRYGEEGAGCEHLWFEVLGLKPGRVQAALCSQPTLVRHLRPGDVEWHDLERLSDWRIFTGFGVFDPDGADALFDDVRRAEPSAAPELPVAAGRDR
ncbi:MAG TPA: hypothetical protein VNC50_14000 [Planctomycetia bacterium]|nr:hypothetical protein [Planctomycetia bacterium]